MTTALPAQPDITADFGDYSYTYAASGGNKVSRSVIGVLIALGIAVPLICFALMYFIESSPVFLPVLILLLFYSGILFHSRRSIGRYRLVLHPDRVEYVGVFSAWTVKRDEIIHWRVSPLKKASLLALTSKADPDNAFLCRLALRPDAAFEAWLAALPHTELTKLTKSELELQQNPNFGATPEQRLAATKQARRIGTLLTFLTAGVFFWLVFYPYPAMLPTWICLALPWVAVMLSWKSKGLYNLGRFSNQNATANIAILLVMPALGLGYWTVSFNPTLNWTQALIPAAALGLLMTLVIGMANKWYSKSVGILLPYASICLLYAISATIITNSVFDRNPPTINPVRVLDKFKSANGPQLSLTEWPEHGFGDQFRVSDRDFDRATINSTICVTQHPGAYRIEWISIEDCTPQAIAASVQAKAAAAATHQPLTPTPPVIIADSQDLTVQPGTSRAWGLAAAAILAQKNEMQHDLLGGWQRGAQVQSNIRQAMIRSWGVHNRVELLAQLKQLKEHGHREEFERMGAHFQAMTQHNYFTAWSTYRYADSSRPDRQEIARRYYAKFGKKSLLAFDLGREINLCRWGYLVGYLNQDEAWADIMTSATQLQNTFDSWQDFSDNYVIGRAFWGGDPQGDKEVKQIVAHLQSVPESPWIINGWDTDLRTPGEH